MPFSTPEIVVIGGGTASGKTTLAQKLVKQLGNGAALIQLDSYYRPLGELTLEERSSINFDHPDAFEYDLLLGHLSELRVGREISVPQYDFSTHTRCAHSTVVRNPEVVVVEGILALLDPGIRELASLMVFVETPEEVRFNRRLARDVRERGRTPESVRRQWHETVQPMHKAFCEPTRAFADIFVDHEDFEGVCDQILLALGRRDRLG